MRSNPVPVRLSTNASPVHLWSWANTGITFSSAPAERPVLSTVPLQFTPFSRRAWLRPIRGEIRVNHAGCLNQCGHGPMVVVYPDDVWYSHVDEAGARRIVEEHLLGGRVVEEYRYVAPPGDNKLVEGDPAP